MAYTKAEREYNKSVLVATLNYLLKYHAQDIVLDDYSPSKEWYLQELRQTELDIEQSRSAQIKKRLDRHILMFREKYDPGLNKYIKENTGYEFDIFEQYKTDVLPIISKGSINSNDIYLVERYFKAYATMPEEQNNITFLKNLKAEYEAHLEELIKNEGLVETFYGFSIGNKSWQGDEAGYKEARKELYKDWLLAEEVAPNGTDTLNVQFNGIGEYALTYVVILLAHGSGTIYCVKGDKLPIKAYWKDSHTVVIETKEAYEFHQKHHQVTSYEQVYKIEYVEG